MLDERFELRDIEGKGRGLFSTQLIPAGEVIGEFQPVVYNPAYEYRKHMCMICLHNVYPKKLPIRLRCGYGYCSESCQNIRRLANTFAEEQALIESVFSICEAMEAPLVVTDTLLVLHALHLHNTSNEEYSRIQSLMPWDLSDLVPHVKELLQLRVDTVMQALSQTRHTDMCSIENVLWDICTRFARNGLTYWDEDYNPGVVTMFDEASMFNHACIPNVVKLSAINIPIRIVTDSSGSKRVQYITSNTTTKCSMSNRNAPLPLVFVATHDIQPGEELVISYTTSDCDEKERKKILTDYFGFECSCPHCTSHNSSSNSDSSSHPSDGLGCGDVQLRVGHDGCGGWWVPLMDQEDDHQNRQLCSICGLVRTDSV